MGRRLPEAAAPQPPGPLWSSPGLVATPWLRADIPGEKGARCLWEELRLENAFLGVGGTSSTLSRTESSTTWGGRWGAIVKLVPHRVPGDTWLQTHETVQMTGFGHQGLIPVALPLPCSSLFFPAGFSILSCIAFPRVLPSPFLANYPIFVSPPPLAAPFWLGYPDWLALFFLILSGFPPSYPFTSNLSLHPRSEDLVSEPSAE